MTEVASLNYQTQFQQRWPQLTHGHVRNLAWIIDSPGLLNGVHPYWQNKIAQLGPVDDAIVLWLEQLNQQPEPLMQFLALHPHTRLGHYAEYLLAYYLSWRATLFAHGVQVRARTTLGEFDFLLTTPEGLVHWEFACKFYLLVAPQSALTDYVGPNLLDNLEAKSKKIIHSQLQLGQRPEAQSYLPTPLTAALALVKGWLFYSASTTEALPEITPQHCRGVWCRLAQLDQWHTAEFVILARLDWLAPARVPLQAAIAGSRLQAQLQARFAADARPVLVAQLQRHGDDWIEIERLFVVPDDWNVSAPII